MPPQLPRRPLHALTSTASRTATTTASPSTTLRLFTTTTIHHAPPSIPPESPKYISVPVPPQSTEGRLPRLKGHLPVPRQIFAKRDGDRKIAPGYVRRATPRSKPEAAGQPAQTELEAWRRKMADSRRWALMEGLEGLWERKKKTDERTQRLGQARNKLNRKKALAEESLEDVLARPSVLGSCARTEVVVDPRRFGKAERAGRKVRGKAAARREMDEEYLSELYIAAKDYILTERELQAKVDELFDAKYFESKGMVDALSVWDLYGKPVSMDRMVDRYGGGKPAAALSLMGDELMPTDVSKTVQKQKMVAEELTGGKLP